MGYIVALVSVFSFALSNCLWVKPLRHLSVWRVMAWRSFITSVLFALLLVISIYSNTLNISSIISFKNITIATYCKTALFCAYSYFGLVFYNLSLKHKTEVSVSVPVTYTSTFWGLCTAYIVYQDAINTNKFLLFSLFFMALFLIEKQATIKQLKLSKGIVFALIAAFIWGTSFALFPVFINDTGVALFSLILETTVCLCSLIIIFVVKEKQQLFTISSKRFMQILPIGLLGFMGVLFFNIATLYLKMSSIILIDILTPIITVVLSAFLLKEKLIPRQYVAIVLILLAVWLIKL